MAGRTSTSFGVAATIVILGIVSLTFFVLTAVFFNKFYDAKRSVDQLQSDQNKIVSAAERNRDDVLTLVKDAEREKKSLVAYLVDSQSTVMEKVTGSKRDTLTELTKKLAAVKGTDSAPLLTLVQDRDSRIATLDDNLKVAESARQQAQADQLNEVARVKGLLESHQKTVDALGAEVGTYKTEVDKYRAGADGYKASVDAQAERERSDAADTKQRLEGQLAKVSDEKLVLEGQLAALRGVKSVEAFRGRPEQANVDAEVIAVNGGERQATIGIGSNQKVVLGMTFAVYGDANSIKPAADGKYPAGKATLEVISVEPSTSTARITSEVRGNPIVRGDVIANAVYDPNKQYKFVVFGNFDVDRDGVPTPLERSDMEALIITWGGKLEADLSGDADFVVLGQRPLLPPRPSQDAPFEVVQEFIRRQREVDRYDGLQKQAESTSVPVLNENRLYTLIGKTPARLGRR